jgi:capsular polysaccharide biosynthesis protein
MSKLSVLLHRCRQRWRTRQVGTIIAPAATRVAATRIVTAATSVADAFTSTVHWMRFAGLVRTFRRPRTIALTSTGFDAYCARVDAIPVASAIALLAGPTTGAPRMWWLPAPEPPPPHSRIIKITDELMPKFPAAKVAYPAYQQGFLRISRAIVFAETGVVMPEIGVGLHNQLAGWRSDHRKMAGFLDIDGDALVACERALYPSRRIRQPVINLCHAYHRNYGHWMIDCLPFLLPWRALLQQGRLAVLLPPLRAAWQRRTLELLGVPASAVIEAAEPSVLCDDMIVPGLRLTDGPNPHALKLQPAPDVRETIEILRGAARHETEIEQPEYIYVSRRGLDSFRTMSNEEDVELAMSRLGFAVIHPDELTFDQQVTYFARARVVAGPHGAGLNNAMFAPAECLVVDIFPDTWSPVWVLHETQLFGHHYLPVAYPSDPALSQPVLFRNAIIAHSTVYRVPPDDFAAIVVGAMHRMGIDLPAARMRIDKESLAGVPTR